MIDFTQRPEYLEFANAVLGVAFKPADCAWLASLDAAGRLLGVVIYSRFTPFHCEMSVASNSPRFLSRSFLNAAFGYPFHQCGHRRVTAVVEDSNTHALQFNKRLGFIEEGRLKKWFGDHDGIVLGMLKEECKWIS